MKITTSSENIQAFGGLNFISSEFNSLGLSQLIDNQLGGRGTFAQFSYSDIIKNGPNLNCVGLILSTNYTN